MSLSFVYTARLTASFLLVFALTVQAEMLPINGIIEPISDIALALPVTGTVASIYVTEGDRVKAGDVLLQLNSHLQTLEVERRQILLESQDNLITARKKETLLKHQVNSARRLYHKNQAISLEDYQKKQLEALNASLERDQLETTEALEKIEFNQAQEKVNERILRAPMDGIITQISIEKGETVEASIAVIRLVDVSKCRFVGALPERQSAQLTLGSRLKLKTETAQGLITRTVTVNFISPVVDPASGLMEFKAILDNQDFQIKPGIPATIQFYPSELTASD